MQAITNAELGSYEIRTRGEIVALLRQIGEKNQLIRLLVRGADVCVTTILRVHPESDTIILDHAVTDEQNARLLAAGQVMCETSLDNIRIAFTATELRPTVYQGGGALSAAIPPTLVRLQRREFYRMATPVMNPVLAAIALPEDRADALLPLHDIGCGGIALLDARRQLDNTIGKVFRNCKIALPGLGTVTTALEVRYSLDLALLNNKTSRRLGCAFVDLSRADMAQVQRYITRLERERNARLAGLS